MKILVVKPYGFCSGVKRALRLLAEAKKRYKKVYTFGKIIHNRPVVERLKKEGIIPLKKVKGPLDGVLAIRTHGIAFDHLKKIKKYGIRLVDTTCPYVRRVQEIVQMLVEEDYKIIMIGDKNHPEVVSIIGNLKEKGFLFPTDGKIPVAALTSLPKRNKVGVVCQTTLAKEFMDFALSEIIKREFSELRVFDTLCQEVLLRQKIFRKLLEKVDAGLVAGGKESANTRRLYEIGCLFKKPTFWIEEEKELTVVLERLTRLGIRSVGFVSGTSTPDDFCLLVIKKLRGGN
ncbi:MAG: 4-hydroxy-3-methylbut-2-enyl diphosphate reductase [candidate division WOR-3 bacterium]